MRFYRVSETLARNMISLIKKVLALSTFVASAVFSVTLSADPVKYSQRETFDYDWKFAKFGKFSDCLSADDPGTQAANPTYSDAKWRKLDLPHDWGIESEFLQSEPNETGKLPWNAIGWYRKTFDVPAKSKGNKFFLDFDGVMMTPQVYVNGQLAGEWAYGYNSFRVDITKYLKFGAKNVVAVRAENKPVSTRWYPGAGIYRHVWIIEANPVHVAHWGIYVTTPDIKGIKKPDDKHPQKEYRAGSARVAVAATISNETSAATSVEIVHEVFPLDGKKDKPVATGKSSTSIPAGGDKTVNVEFTMNAPKLWDILAPSLYILRTTVSIDGKMTDRQDTIFGVRKAEWKADGFYLNDRRVQIRGVCQHHDMGPLGSAVHRRALERQVEVLKSFGANSIRTSHNPPAPELLELCDRMGVLVDAELFDIWKYQKYDKRNGYHVYWEKWWKKDVENFVLRDRNHPSIISWSAGNEIDEQGKPDGKEIAKGLIAEFKKYDKTRAVTAGCNNANAASNGFGDLFDVYGFNYKPWMYKGYTSKKKPFIGSETSSCVSTRGKYYFPKADVFWDKGAGFFESQVSSYDLYAPGWAYRPDVEFAALEDEPKAAGEYVWTGFDYIGEPTPYNQDASNEGNYQNLPEAERKAMMEKMAKIAGRSMSRSSYFGIVDLCGFWKDRTYLYQSHWLPDVPMVHILPHWNWKGERDGKVTPVHVYTSGDTVELKLNGKVIGKKSKGKGDKDRFRIVFEDVVYQPGKLEATAYKKGKKWATDVVETSDAPAKISAEVDRSVILGDGRDLAYVTIKILDAKDRMVPTADNALKFSVSGSADIVGVCNGDPTDLTSMKGNEIKAFSGMAQVILRSKRDSSGKATLKISGSKLPGKTVEIEVKKPSARQLRVNT
ncbi:MAG: DUF4982 domain-containing protein [Opitutae bacterium]|nr:DUF4982 domain-containing protein [Opitutae bacterium]